MLTPDQITALGDAARTITDPITGYLLQDIARRVADLHGGTLVADCAPGKGLRVTVSIPLGTPGGTVCRTPEIVWDRGGFGEELIALSNLLPVRAFGPGDK